MPAVDRRTVLHLGLAALAALTAHCRRRNESEGTLAGRRPPARRIVSVSPSTTETLFALGAGDRLVARSRFCDFPPEVQRLPVVGDYLDVSLEAVLALRPDLVTGARGPGRERLAERLAAFGIPTLFPPEESIADVLAIVDELARAVGLPERGTSLRGQIEQRLESIGRAVGLAPRPTVLMIVGANPVVAVGAQSFIGELLARAGARNVVHSNLGYPTLGAEELVALDPDLLIDATTLMSHGSDAVRPDAPGFREMRAVRDHHVLLLNDVAALRPGPRLGQGLASLVRLIHPGLSIP